MYLECKTNEGSVNDCSVFPKFGVVRFENRGLVGAPH